MKKLFLPLILSGFVAANASAITVQNDDLVYFGPGGVTQYDGSFNLNSAGYDHKKQQITSATATFTFLDILGPERLEISLDGSYFGSSSSIFGFVHLGGKVVGSALLELSDTGFLEYRIKKTSGYWTDFILTNAKLTAVVGARVPDGGVTLTLLGLAFLGILGAQRKFALAR
jgi:hypothetical protein